MIHVHTLFIGGDRVVLHGASPRSSSDAGTVIAVQYCHRLHDSSRRSLFGRLGGARQMVGGIDHRVEHLILAVN